MKHVVYGHVIRVQREDEGITITVDGSHVAELTFEPVHMPVVYVNDAEVAAVLESELDE